MNIFFTDKCPVLCAQSLDNRRLNKMMLETVQLFGYAMNNLGIDESYYPVKKDGTPYKSTGSHTKHPCTLWLQKSKGNYRWLHGHLVALCREYEYRYKKKCSYWNNVEKVLDSFNQWPEGDLTPFCNSSAHKIEGSVVLSYRLTMIEKWELAKESGDARKSVSFGNRGEPGWYSFLKENASWRRQELK